MLKKFLVKNILLGIVLLTIVGMLAACGGGKEKANNQASETSDQEKKKIVVATAAMPKPFTYVDDSGELTGYDIEVAKAVFKKLPQYEVEFQKTEFPSVLAGLDSGMYQLGANNFAYNDERAEKYIYSDPIFENQFVIAVREDNTDIKSFSDLAGKKTENQPGVNFTTAMENYNKNNSGNKINLKYTDADVFAMLQNVESGKMDFNLIDKAMLQMYINEFGLKLKAIPLSEDEQKMISESTYSYFLVSKGEEGEKLVKDVNKAIKEVIEDGTVSEISKKFFGEDFAPKEE